MSTQRRGSSDNEQEQDCDGVAPGDQVEESTKGFPTEKKRTERKAQHDHSRMQPQTNAHPFSSTVGLQGRNIQGKSKASSVLSRITSEEREDLVRASWGLLQSLRRNLPPSALQDKARELEENWIKEAAAHEACDGFHSVRSSGGDVTCSVCGKALGCDYVDTREAGLDSGEDGEELARHATGPPEPTTTCTNEKNG